MSSIQFNSFFDLKPLSASFDNSLLSLKQTEVVYEQNANFNFIDGLSGAIDAKVGNHSNLFLTNKLKDTDIFNIQNITDTYNVFTTTIGVSTLAQGLLFLNYIPVSNTFNFVQSAVVRDLTNLIFEIELFDDTFCRIKHVYEGVKYYLNYDTSTSSFSFKTGVDYDLYNYSVVSSYTNDDVFKYIVDPVGNITFRKYVTGSYNILSYNTATSSFRLSSFQQVGNLIYRRTNVFLINYPTDSLNLKLNTSWVHYDSQNINQGSVDAVKSSFDIPNNNIIHYEYNNINDNYDVKVLKLKNTLTEKNYSKRASSMFLSGGKTGKINTPVPFFRDYVGIQTGINSENAYPDLTLNYVSYEKDFIVRPGEIAKIETSETLYPYSQINVNDTTFVKDGAFGSVVPYISDKIYFDKAIKGDTQTSKYLTTWLSAGTVGEYGVWVDRYYYPDLVSRTTALTSSAVYPSFIDPVQLSVKNVASVQANPFFDKVSDLVFLPNQTYYYSRVGKDQIASFISAFQGLIYKDFSTYITIDGIQKAVDATSLNFDGDKYIVYDISSINDTSAFTLQFDIITNWYSNKFNNLFGALLDRGFSITNDEKITPFSYIFGASSVEVYNSNLTLLYSISTTTSIKDVIVGDHLQDFYIATTRNLIKVNSNGQVKTVTPFSHLSSYISYDISYPNELAMLINTAGNCVLINLDDFTTTTFTVSGLTNFDTQNGFKSIRKIDNTYYGLAGEKTRIYNDNYLYYLSAGKQIYRENLITLSADPVLPFCTTASTIYDFNIDKDGNIFILHNINNLTVVDNNRKILFNSSLNGITSAYAIDFVSEYGLSGYNYFPVVLGRTPTGNLTLNTLNSDYTVMQSVTSVLSGGYIPTSTISNLSSRGRIKNITNYNYFQTNSSADYLNFNLALKNYYNDTDYFRNKFSIPTSVLRGGAHTITVVFDNNNGKYQIYTNGILVNNVDFDNNKYRFTPVLKTDFVLGATGFHNNPTLATFLQQPGYYFVDNVIVENFKLYNSALQPYQVLALSLDSREIDTLNISLPVGQRNQIEEIDRVFKFTQPTNASNSVNIIVKNLGDITPALQNAISNNLLLNIANNTPGDLNINSITFENYK